MSLPIGVVGGGFTGAVFCVHLANVSPIPLDIQVIEPREQVGFGLAYGACGKEHRINVPSDRMSVFAERPRDFTDWLELSGCIDADPAGWTPSGDFYSTRTDFGLYVAHLFGTAAKGNRSGSSFQHRRQSVVAFEPGDQRWRAHLDDRTTAEYVQLVLAATYPIPAFRVPVDSAALSRPGLIADPWDQEAIKALPHDANIGIIGTGLTMCDVLVTLRTHGHRGPISAISRHGLVPRPHAGFSTTFDLFRNEPPPDTAVGLIRLLRQRIVDAQESGETWHVVIDAFRFQLAHYWPKLTLVERKKITRHLRTWWDVHRFRIAPQVDDLMTKGLTEGWLSIEAGHVHSIGVGGKRLSLVWKPKGGRQRMTTFDAVVNCTGPDSDISRSSNKMLRSAADAGHIRPDPFRAGIDVDEYGRVSAADGSIRPGLWAAGPLARTVVGEATGVPEASGHARVVADSLAATLSSNSWSL
jgi:uncharacterized NAD(P)/FAD-binding protein YdhS